MQTRNATLHDPNSGLTLAEITLLGKPVDTGSFVLDHGHLQTFVVRSGQQNLLPIWLQRQTVQLRPHTAQRRTSPHHTARLITYPNHSGAEAVLCIAHPSL